MMVKTVTALALRLVRKDAPERPLYWRPPCQSEIKRTLRGALAGGESGYVRWAFAGRARVHSMQMVNVGFPERTQVWFRNGGRVESTAKAGIN
jgi:hypothetical protein